MIELFYANTPNGRKISIMLEEINCPYKVTLVDIFNGKQFDPKFIDVILYFILVSSSMIDTFLPLGVGE